MARGKVSLAAVKRAYRSSAARASAMLSTRGQNLGATRLLLGARTAGGRAFERARAAGRDPRIRRLSERMSRLVAFDRYGAWYALALGMIGVSLFLTVFDNAIGRYPNPGLLYLVTVAFITFRWGWRMGVVTAVAQMVCADTLFYPPLLTHGGLSLDVTLRLLTLAGGSAAIIALIAMATRQRSLASRESGRYVALMRMGESLSQVKDELEALRLIAHTAIASTASGFAALVVTLPDSNGDAGPGAEQTLYLAPLGPPSAHDATDDRLTLIARDGPLARLYLGKPARIGDLTAGVAPPSELGRAPRPDPYALGALDGARSVIAVPVIDRDGRTHGGIALGHKAAHYFSDDDVALLTSLGRLAMMTVENEQLLRTAQERAQELDVIFEHVGDAISLLDARGNTKRENRAARQLRQAMMFGEWPDDEDEANDDASGGATAVRTRDVVRATPVALLDRRGVAREYEVRHATLIAPSSRPTGVRARPEEPEEMEPVVTGAVVVHHDVTETRRLIEERQAREEAETRRTLLQSVVDQVPAGVFLVRGPDARMVLANAVAQQMFGADWPVGMPLATFFEQSGMRVRRHEGSQVAFSDLATLRTLVGGEPARHVQMLLCQAGGATLSVLLNAVPLDGATLGEPAGALDPIERAAIVVLQDVSALKEVERLKDDFIAIAAHELKSPVAEIKGNVDTLLLQTARGNGHALDLWQREAMEAVERGSARLVQLANDLLDVSRIQAGRLE
ncbi:MAG: histidine kinase dimerization/phospho-acceptor domain-containing protein, partial [Ktedonobacterales bacterium]